MKYRTCFLICVFISVHAYSKPIDLEKIDTTKKNRPVVAVTSFNTIYKGVDNPIEIAIPGINSEFLIVTIDNGTISGNKGSYSVNIKTGNSAYVHIVSVYKNDTVTYKPYKLRVIKLPNPVVSLCGITDSGRISKSELLSTEGLSALFDGIQLNLACEINSFEVKLNSEKDKTYTSSDRRFTEEMRTIFKKLKTGDVLYFLNIKGDLPDGTIRDLNQVKIEIK